MIAENQKLTPRQQREIEYHKEHARRHKHRYESLSWDIIEDRHRRWWNQVWAMYTEILKLNVAGKRVLVVGCGFGDDAFRIAKLDADVYAFDLSPDVLEVAKEVADREQLRITFSQMAAERLLYQSDFFDCIIVRDILHHVEVRKALSEIVRVAKAGAHVVINEIYTHSLPDRIRHSHVVERYLYPAMQNLIYGGEKPYITEDEQKLNEQDLMEILQIFHAPPSCRFFDFVVNRLIPERFRLLNKLDYLVLNSLGPFAQYIAGRILIVGKIAKVALVKKPTFSSPLAADVQPANSFAGSVFSDK